MSTSDASTATTPGARLLARELGLALLALIGVGVLTAAVMIGLILLLYSPR